MSLAQDATQAMLSAGLDFMSERAKLIIGLRVHEGLDFAEVGEVLGGVPASVVRELHLKAVDDLLRYLFDAEMIYRSGTSQRE